MKKADHFIWTQCADDAFKDLKCALSTVPVLVAPALGELMLFYIASTPRVVSVVVIVEKAEEGKELSIQRHVYYLREVLSLSLSKTTRTTRRWHTVCTWQQRS
jgi:hypothetical protein